jgi:hypothetical protein
MYPASKQPRERSRLPRLRSYHLVVRKRSLIAAQLFLAP